MKEDGYTKLEMKEIATRLGHLPTTHIICYGDVFILCLIVSNDSNDLPLSSNTASTQLANQFCTVVICIFERTYPFSFNIFKRSGVKFFT